MSGESREAKIKALVAKMYCAAGCSCCRDTDAWNESTNALAALFDVPAYSDDSGFDWYKIRDEIERSTP